MNPKEVLGLPSGAFDAAALRRAYATQLRLHRPTDDPVGFRQVRDAYETLAAWLARGGVGAGGGASPDPWDEAGEPGAENVLVEVQASDPGGSPELSPVAPPRTPPPPAAKPPQPAALAPSQPAPPPTPPPPPAKPAPPAAPAPSQPAPAPSPRPPRAGEDGSHPSRGGSPPASRPSDVQGCLGEQSAEAVLDNWRRGDRNTALETVRAMAAAGRCAEIERLASQCLEDGLLEDGAARVELWAAVARLVALSAPALATRLADAAWEGGTPKERLGFDLASIEALVASAEELAGWPDAERLVLLAIAAGAGSHSAANLRAWEAALLRIGRLPRGHPILAWLDMTAPEVSRAASDGYYERVAREHQRDYRARPIRDSMASRRAPHFLFLTFMGLLAFVLCAIFATLYPQCRGDGGRVLAPPVPADAGALLADPLAAELESIAVLKAIAEEPRLPPQQVLTTLRALCQRAWFRTAWHRSREVRDRYDAVMDVRVPESHGRARFGEEREVPPWEVAVPAR